jgi:uncharacterized protein
MIVVSDTSPITSLIHVGALSILEKLYGSVLIPVAVERELRQSHSVLPDFLMVREARNRQGVDSLQSELDAGEAEAIVAAKEVNADLLLMDEKIGRFVAQREGLPVIGLMGILIEAKRARLITSVRTMVAALEAEAGFRVSEMVKNEVFAAAGE